MTRQELYESLGKRIEAAHNRVHNGQQVQPFFGDIIKALIGALMEAVSRCGDGLTAKQHIKEGSPIAYRQARRTLREEGYRGRELRSMTHELLAEGMQLTDEELEGVVNGADDVPTPLPPVAPWPMFILAFLLLVTPATAGDMAPWSDSVGESIAPWPEDVSYVEDEPHDPPVHEDLRAAIESEFPGAFGDSGPELPADAQPTPWYGISRGLNTLNVTKNDVPIDPGVGADARVLIEAAKYTDARKFIGVEIDPGRADSARSHVREFERSYPEHRGKIEIVTGDSTKLDWRELGANIAFVYMWPDTLGKMREQLTSMDRVVGFWPNASEDDKRQLSSLGMKFDGHSIWMLNKGREQATSTPQYTTETRSEPIYGTRNRVVTDYSLGRCQLCGETTGNGRHQCSNPMRYQAERVIIGYRPVTVRKEAARAASPKARDEQFVSQDVSPPPAQYEQQYAQGSGYSPFRSGVQYGYSGFRSSCVIRRGCSFQFRRGS